MVTCASISRQAVPSDDHTDGPHSSGAWQQGETGLSNRTCVRSSRLTALTAGEAPSRIWPIAALGALLGPSMVLQTAADLDPTFCSLQRSKIRRKRLTAEIDV